MVSRIPEPMSAMSSRSIPIPVPPLGGIPYSIAVRKSSSRGIASSSPGTVSAGLGLETLPLHDRIDQL